MFEKEELLQFIHEASKATYASGDQSLFTKEPDGSTTILYERGEWKFHDNFFGGEPYGGREVVFFKGKAVFMMVYYGWVEKSVHKPDAIYAVLQEALRNAPASNPFRGPAQYPKDHLLYTFHFDGSVERFTGEEVISENSQRVYNARFAGGYVDLH